MIKFAVVGTNWITERFIKEASELPEFKLSAVYSRTEERAKEFASEYGIESIFTDLTDLAKSQEVDAVYIASPNAYHAEQAILFMNNGKHVLCEKPMASNTAEVKRMVACAKENQVMLMEAVKTTLLPNFQVIKEHLHKIGKVRRYVASYCQYSSRYDAYKQGVVLNAFKPELSNGSLMDIGFYCLYPLVVLFGGPTAIKANGILLDTGVDGEGSILLGYKEMEAVAMYSKITNSHTPSEIQGEEGSIVIDKIHTPEKVEIYYRDGTVENITQSQKPESMYYEVKEFIECIKAGKTESNINSFTSSVITAEIIENARKQLGVTYPADR